MPPRDYLLNSFVGRIPVFRLRMAAYRLLGLRVGSESSILMATEFYAARHVSIGRHTVINPHCYLDGRGGLTIGDNVNISSHVVIVAGTHDIHDGAEFSGSVRPICIEDYAWLCTRCTILAGVTVGRGAVVAAGAVVTHAVPPFTVVGGVPARKIGERTPELSYTLTYPLSWR
jgi:acetyltransferase-like isoleucine patch superfamily enzyme